MNYTNLSALKENFEIKNKASVCMEEHLLREIRDKLFSQEFDPQSLERWKVL